MNTSTLFPVAILAGGLATRMQPLTATMPKSLLEVHGEPFIYHQLRLLKKQGIAEVVICTGHFSEQIEAAVGDGCAFGLTVRYSCEGPQLLGTGGAIKKALPKLPEQFFVLYGDSYLLCDYRAVQQVFLQQQKQGLMTIFHNGGRWDQSNVEYEHGIIKRYDKKQKTPAMQYIDYGLGVFQASAYDAIPADTPYDLACFYQLLLAKGQLAAFPVQQRFYEIGSFAGLEDLRYYLSTSCRVD